jgi:hypothetical protein
METLLLSSVWTFETNTFQVPIFLDLYTCRKSHQQQLLFWEYGQIRLQ